MSAVPVPLTVKGAEPPGSAGCGPGPPGSAGCGPGPPPPLPTAGRSQTCPEHVHALASEVTDQANSVAHVIIDVIAGGRLVGLGKPAQVRHNHAPAVRGEPDGKRLPTAAAHAPAVKAQNRVRALAPLFALNAG